VPLRFLVREKSGAVYSFVRPSNSRDPAHDFFQTLQKDIRDRFDGNFGVFANMGSEYENYIRFKPLHNNGKPLWEFKEHAFHLYTVREVFTLVHRNGARQQIAVAVLLNGWKKEKGGQGKKEEAREIKSAISLYDEYRSTGVRNNDGEQEPMGTASERKARL
jgi:hypothetical protein